MNQANSNRRPRPHYGDGGFAHGQPQDRPTPHFFWQDAPGNQNDPAFRHSRRRDCHSAIDTAIDSHEFDATAFETPPWFTDAEPSSLHRRGAIIIAAALTVSCGIGLGLLLLLLQGAGSRAPQTAMSLPAAQPSIDNQPPALVEANLAGAATVTQIQPASVITSSKANRHGTIISPQAGMAGSAAGAQARPTQSGAQQTPRPVDPAIIVLRQRAGEQLLAGDITGARAFLMKAAKLGDAAAAYELARSYDPDVVKTLNVIGPQANPQLALHWYRQASAGGHDGATQWLAHLQAMAAARQAAN